MAKEKERSVKGVLIMYGIISAATLLLVLIFT
jgi:hypothetical protein